MRASSVRTSPRALPGQHRPLQLLRGPKAAPDTRTAANQYREVEAAANQYEDDEQEESYNNSSSSQSGPRRPHHHQQEHSSSFAESDSAGPLRARANSSYTLTSGRSAHNYSGGGATVGGRSSLPDFPRREQVGGSSSSSSSSRPASSTRAGCASSSSSTAASSVVPSKEKTLEKSSELSEDELKVYGNRWPGGGTTSTNRVDVDHHHVHGGGEQSSFPFRRGRLLGRGGCAIVWLANRDQNEGPGGRTRTYAVKQVAKQQLQRGELVLQRGTQLAALWKEMKILQKLKDDAASSDGGHPHIANLHAFVETKSDLWFVLENGGTPISKQLSLVKGEFVRNTRMYRVHHLEWYEELKSSPHPLRSFLRQVLAAFAFLHSANCEIVHADVKPENILRNAQSGLVKLCDFGSAFSAREDAPSSLGTPEYMAPEQLDRQINWQQTSTGGGGASSASSGGRYSSTAGGGSGGVAGRISAIISTGGGGGNTAPRTSATELARRDALLNKYCGVGSAAATSSAAKGGPSSVAAAPPVGGGAARDDAKVLEHLAGDMWSVGMIFLELCHGVPLWLSYDCCVGQRKTQGLLGASGRDFRKIRQKQISVVKNLEALLRRDCFGLQIGDSELAVNFLACLLQPNPRERLTAPESLAHPFLAAD